MNDFSEGNPFIGVVTTNKAIDDICIPKDPDLILWSLEDGSIYWKGKFYCKTHIVCSSDSIVTITWNTKRNEIKLTVKSTSGKVQTEVISVETLDSNTIWPVFGAIKVSSFEALEIEILDNEEEQQELRDVTKNAKFVSPMGKMSVSNDGKQVYRSNSENGNGIALINKVLSYGRHRWKLMVTCDFGASVALGLAPPEFELPERYLNDPKKHVYHHQDLLMWRSYKGQLFVNGKLLPRTLEPLGWHNGLAIEVEFVLDMRKKTLEIFKNGKPLGVAFSDIQGPVQPIAAFYAGYQKEIHLVEFWSSDILSTGDVVEADRASRMAGDIAVTFDPKSVSGKLLLSEDGLTLTREREHSGNAYCLLGVTLSSGVYRWSFVVQTDQGASTCVGVAREPISLPETGNLYFSKDLHVFRSFQGILYSAGREVRKGLGEFWLTGSLVEVSVEIQPQGAVVQFSVNGEDQGVAFSGLAPPLRPMVGFYAGMQKKITLVHYEHVPVQLKHPSPSKLEKNDFEKNDFQKNDLNTDKTNHVDKANPMPLLLSPSSISTYYSECLVCGSPVNTVALPCKHSYMCADHLEIGQHCLICDETVNDIWNIVLL